MREQHPATIYPAKVFVDSSAFYALADRRDNNHQSAVEIASRMVRASRTRLFLTNFIRAEAHALILNRLGHTAADRFLQDLSHIPPGSLVRVSEADEQKALELIAKYQDKDFSVTDATSFVVMERLGIRYAFSFDRNFAQYGLTLLKADLL